MDSRNGAAASRAGDASAGLPGPGDGFGRISPGWDLGFLRGRLSESKPVSEAPFAAGRSGVGNCPIDDAGAFESLRLPPPGSSLESLVMDWRNGKACSEARPSAGGRKRSDAPVWATALVVSHATSARHGASARNSTARLRRPLAGPDITM
jgi:hypothetical protein